MSLPDWKCWCGKDADYAQGRRKYCTEHWNYGEPVKPTLDTCLEARQPDWYKQIKKEG